MNRSRGIVRAQVDSSNEITAVSSFEQQSAEVLFRLNHIQRLDATTAVCDYGRWGLADHANSEESCGFRSARGLKSASIRAQFCIVPLSSLTSPVNTTARTPLSGIGERVVAPGVGCATNRTDRKQGLLILCHSLQFGVAVNGGVSWCAPCCCTTAFFPPWNDFLLFAG